MSVYRVGVEGALVLNDEGIAFVLLPGMRVSGDVTEEPTDDEKMRRHRSDKSRRAGRDYEDKQR